MPISITCESAVWVDVNGRVFLRRGFTPGAFEI